MSLLLATSGDIASGVVEPEGVDFDGKTDYLSRSTDLVGNVNSKTFTFSCWVYLPDVITSDKLYLYGNGSGGSFFAIDSIGDSFNIKSEISNIAKLIVNTPSIKPKQNTWFNVIISCDMSNSLKRHIIINDTAATASWNTYVDSVLGFSSTHHDIAYKLGDTKKLFGRLSHLFLDYTYRDLSIEANRRLFITADGKPTPMATLKALNPILYLPMKDAATAHINEGTGGNFTLNGTIATSDRGANQDNCVASKFDGVDDSLSSVSIPAQSASRYALFSCQFNLNALVSGRSICQISNGVFSVRSTATDISFLVYTTGPVLALEGNIVIAPTLKKDYSLQIMYDGIGNTVQVLLNGVLQSPTWTTQIYGNVLLSFATNALIMSAGGAPLSGNAGELYFDTNYIDLSTNNPFWDSETNKPIPVRKAMANLGSNPLICMPIDASNPTKNYGSGGDFTLNGGGLVGARGGSEFLARSVKSNLIAGSNLSNTSNLGGVADGKTFSAVVIAKHNDWTYPLVTFNGATENIRLAMSTAGAVYSKEAATSNYNLIMSMSGFVNGAWNIGFISVDLTDTNKTFTYLNGTTTTAKNTFVNSNIGFSETTVSYVGKSSTDAIQGENAYVYFTTDYIDFSQEVNRNKFVSQLGYPRDLAPLIEEGTIPTPLIYLPFDDPSNLGKNLGTGVDFVVNGTVTQGADFSL